MVTHEVFRYCETKKWKENRDMQKSFRDPTHFESYKSFPGNFCVLWDKKIRMKIVILRSHA